MNKIVIILIVIIYFCEESCLIYAYDRPAVQ